MSSTDPLYSELQDLEIRVLKVLPGRWNDEIDCELLHVPLYNTFIFDALSYAWGSTKRVRSITLNGRAYMVTASAYQALRRLRETYGPTTVWIDALCINQSDIGERTRQVGLMRDIFSGARQVIVYLGEPQLSKAPSKPTFFRPEAEDGILSSFAARCSQQDASETSRTYEALEVFCLIHSIAKAQNLENTAPFDVASRRAAESKYQRRLFEALRQLMRCRWWDRMWTLQEAVVPRDVTIIYGSCISTWDMLLRAAKAYSDSKGSEAIASIPPEYTKVLDFYSQTVLGIETMRTRWTSGERTTLLPLLRKFSGRRATDPRDRVYALLGLVRGYPPVFSDYSIDVTAVYMRTALGIISSTGSLSILNGDIGRKLRQDLPSWVPDWTAEYHDLDRHRAETVDHYRATRKSSFYVQSIASGRFNACEDAYEAAYIHSKWNEFLNLSRLGRLPTRSKCLEIIEEFLTVKGRLIEHSDNGVISLQGYCLDGVLVVGRVNMSETDLIPTIQSWAILAKRKSEGPIEWSAFMRTLCADIVYPQDRSASGCRRICHEDLNTIAHWFIHQPRSPFGREQDAKNSQMPFIRHEMERAFPENEPSNEIHATIDVEHSIIMATSRRAFFMTQDGSFGIGPAQTVPSDKVYALLGAHTPFILRPVDRSSLERRINNFDGKSYHEFIGDCFLFGAMDGEAIKTWQEALATRLEQLSSDSRAWMQFLRSMLSEKRLADVHLV